MANDYKDYNYEDTDIEKKAVIKKRIVIGLLLVVSIIVVIILLKSCSNRTGGKEPVEESFVYENEILDAAKKYYEYNEYKLPTSIGECTTVELSTLKQLGLLKASEFEKCDETLSYVQVCMIEDKSYHWGPWLSCEDKKSENEYGEEKEGTIKDLVKDESLISFKYLPQIMKENAENLGKVEEIWKDEITYPSYKTLNTIKYYRYKDQSWIWNTINKTYYTSTGEQTNANNVKEYYKSSPSSKYKLSEAGTTGYKWYTQTQAQKEYYMKNGVKGSSATAPEGYPYKEGGTKAYVYQRLSSLYYRCKTSENSSTYVDQQVACSNSEGKNVQNPSYTYTEKQFYGCMPSDGGKVVEVEKGSYCGELLKSCPPGTQCRQGTVMYYNWYKLVGEVKKSYYPSGSASAINENVYYVNAPVDGAIKDESTKTTVYKWYYQTEGQTTDYLSTSPGEGATKTDKTKWSDWTEWSTNEPKTASYRKIESKIKIQLQEIKGINEDGWEDMSNEYLTQEEMIKLLNDKGYVVTSLADISNLGNIRYKVKMYVKNKKGGNK